MPEPETNIPVIAGNPTNCRDLILAPKRLISFATDNKSFVTIVVCLSRVVLSEIWQKQEACLSSSLASLPKTYSTRPLETNGFIIYFMVNVPICMNFTAVSTGLDPKFHKRSKDHRIGFPVSPVSIA